jgi:hypothetical protein
MQEDPILNSRPVWDGDIETFFSLVDIGCMRDDSVHRFLDLGSYESVVAYIRESPSSRERILHYLETGIMPQGGPRWDADKFARFRLWVDDDCPRSLDQTPLIP